MPRKTYLLPPNFSLETGAIGIGNIIADPYSPTTNVLSRPPTPPVTTTHVDRNCEFVRENHHALQGNIWTWCQLLELPELPEPRIGARVASRGDRNQVARYAMDVLQTVRMQPDPSAEGVVERLRDPRVQSFFRSGTMGPAPVYMISGVKIARGLRYTAASVQASAGGGGVGAGVGIPAVLSFSAGANLEGQRFHQNHNRWHSEGEVIFGYQLYKIRRRRLHAGLEVGVYAPPQAALLGQAPGHAAADEIEVTMEEVAVEDLEAM
ncbi:hypothetical protein BO71DRAFT_413990 [Aspergillus ellipticus CBS 707.79]|uniref:Uncharacterized protein n=1 Tax=Aspergillus ellipticus CBS 707.79 TaxID=1448320 RepID=A0A319DBY5_9EURO|nr:hypothetical protein BO71DRAFT_413990 [Aspergillus ellipticus CBS 707.79]